MLLSPLIVSGLRVSRFESEYFFLPTIPCLCKMGFKIFFFLKLCCYYFL